MTKDLQLGALQEFCDVGVLRRHPHQRREDSGIRHRLRLLHRGDAEQLLPNRAGIGRFKYAGEQLAHLLQRVLMHERRHALPIRRAHGRDEPLGHLLRSLSGLRLGGLSLGSAGGQRYQQ